MKDRGKAVETYSNVPDFNYSASEMPCKKHPNSSSVGVCAYCLKDSTKELGRISFLIPRQGPSAVSGAKNNDLDQGSDYAFSSAKISDVTNGIFFDSDKQYGSLQESGPRKCGFRRGKIKWSLIEFYNRSIFPVRESDLSTMDDSAFIDLKLDFSSDCKQDFSAGTISGASDHGESPASSKRDRLWGDKGSCRITVNERGTKRESRSQKVWKWIFKY
ncbi:hypothetical protein Sango_1094600 [Sesamum angolense]|uniref:Uncharacterized protein n=1 Tax=Sesamum angolense TaxID=2727404 RepID=A0AAE1WUR0_9LAMI|nr:hypothetical protein Sango_1094600 [Sesamum angolense]